MPRLPHPADDENGLRVKQLIDSIRNPTAQAMVPQYTYVVRTVLEACPACVPFMPPALQCPGYSCFLHCRISASVAANSMLLFLHHISPWS